MLLLRDLAGDQASANDRLCSLFDSFTADGSDMSHYDELLRKALTSIEHTFAKRAATNLLSSRDALLPQATETPAGDDLEFDLVTWLVIMEQQS